MKDKRYTVNWSRSVKALTITLSIIFVLTELFLLIASFNFTDDWHDRAWCLFTFIVILSVSAYTMALTPLSISLTPAELILYRPIGKKKFPIDCIQHIDVYNEEAGIRIFGSGGFWGFVGLFYSKQLGKHSAYVGDYHEAFYIILNSGKKVVLSCENRDFIISSITEHNAPNSPKQPTN